MSQYVAITIIVFVVVQTVNAPPPVRLTIDCGRGTKKEQRKPFLRNSLLQYEETFDVESFCKLIHSAIPKAVKDGKFVLIEPYDDLDVHADTQVPVIVAPPKGLGGLKFRVPVLRIPRLNVPRLTPSSGPVAPIVGKSVRITSYRDDSSKEEDSSAERMEKFKKGVQKMLHFVKVLGQVDRYLTERTKIIIEKLSKTFSE